MKINLEGKKIDIDDLGSGKKSKAKDTEEDKKEEED